jgi:hypothetical protein
MTFFESFYKWNGKFVDVDMKLGPQCMDWMHQYLIDVFGMGKTALGGLTALSVWNNFPSVISGSQFKKISNGWWNVPNKGDVVFWGYPFGKYIDANGKTKYAGHVAIFNEGNWRRFTSIDQNFPLHTPVHVQEHNYRGVKGWLRHI